MRFSTVVEEELLGTGAIPVWEIYGRIDIRSISVELGVEFGLGAGDRPAEGVRLGAGREFATTACSSFVSIGLLRVWELQKRLRQQEESIMRVEWRFL